MPLGQADIGRLKGAVAIGADGGRLGVVESLYFGVTDDQPRWAAVSTGWFGGAVTLVPLRDAELRGDELHVPYDKDQLRQAPHRDPGTELGADEEAALFRHYGIAYERVDHRSTGG